MFPHQIIYKQGKSVVPGEVNLRPNLIVRIGYHLLRGFGAGIIAFAFIGIIFTFWPIAKEEIVYNFAPKEKVEISKFAPIINRSLASDLGLDPYFSLFIPKISAKAKIIPNVDAGNQKAYLNALMEGVAHAAGTNFPGQ